MTVIPVRLKERSYAIHAGAPLRSLGAAVKKSVSHKGRPPHRALIVTHPFLKRRYGGALLAGLKASGIPAEWALIPEGERSKDMKTVERLYHACVRAGLDRTSCVIALGGGVAGDVAGFAAATYLRGIALVQVPTTLLAMVDSSIGGKTGVDLPEAKNFVGAFHQPSLVWIDASVLSTLPEREFRNGMAEVIKYGVIADRPLFELLEREVPLSPSHPKLPGVIARCAAIKADVVAKDERETRGLREILNFGHTLGHAIETVTGYKSYKHGEAISIGMAAAGFISRKMGRWNDGEWLRLESLLERAGLPTRLARPLPPQKILAALFRDKKARSGNLRFVLADRLGRVGLDKIDAALALQALAYVQPVPRRPA